MDIAREAKWDGEVMAKTYLGGRSVGVELVDVGDMGRVADMAKSAGAAVTTNEDPAASFRHLGIEG